MGRLQQITFGIWHYEIILDLRQFLVVKLICVA
jgi:hypothetical protein